MLFAFGISSDKWHCRERHEQRGNLMGGGTVVGAGGPSAVGGFEWDFHERAGCVVRLERVSEVLAIPRERFLGLAVGWEGCERTGNLADLPFCS